MQPGEPANATTCRHPCYSDLNRHSLHTPGLLAVPDNSSCLQHYSPHWSFRTLNDANPLGLVAPDAGLVDADTAVGGDRLHTGILTRHALVVDSGCRPARSVHAITATLANVQVDKNPCLSYLLIPLVLRVLFRLLLLFLLLLRGGLRLPLLLLLGLRRSTNLNLRMHLLDLGEI